MRSPDLTLHLLGGFELRDRDGSPLALSSMKAKALLTYLALMAVRAVSRDKVAALLWPYVDNEQARTSLRQTLSALRRAMPETAEKVIESSTQELSIDRQRIKVDVVEFEDCLAEGGRQRLERAVALYKGPLVDGFEVRAEPFEEWLRDERQRLAEEAAKALESLVETGEAEGDYAAALLMANRLLRLDPLREDVHCRAIRLLQRQSRLNDALKQYEICCSVLHDELGVAPAEETRALYQEIIRQRDEGSKTSGGLVTGFESTSKNSMPEPLSGEESKPSIAILPFDDLGDDSVLSYLSDGITEDIITELSRFPELFVIARNSTFVYKDQAVTAKDVRRELGVQYVVGGSVRKSDKRIRVTAQLIEAESGRHIWANRYDKELVHVFDLQDELVREIVGVLPGRIENFEARKIVRKPPEDMAAYELLLAGKIHHHRFTKTDNDKAMELIERAIAIDPNYAAAHAWKACLLGQAMGRGFRPDPKALVAQAIESVERAISLDENEVECHRILGEIFMETRRWDKAKQHSERALSLNVNDPRLVAQKGELLTWTGNAGEGAEHVRLAMRLDPFTSPAWAHLLGRALMLLEKYADAVGAYAKSSFPRFGYHADMAGCYAKLDRMEDARREVAATLEMNPGFSVENYVEGLLYQDDGYRKRHRSIIECAPFSK